MGTSRTKREPRPAPFDFTGHMHRLCADIAGRMPDFAHVDMQRVAVCFAQARNRRPHGLQAKLTPLRFHEGSLTTRRNGRRWTLERVFHADREMLYILTFYLPRFQQQPFHEKLVTVFHELYHIHPACNGDIRRFDGHYHVHTHSKKGYDAHMGSLAREYLALRPPDALHGFLRASFSELVRRHGAVVGLRLPVPKLVPAPNRG